MWKCHSFVQATSEGCVSSLDITVERESPLWTNYEHLMGRVLELWRTANQFLVKERKKTNCKSSYLYQVYSSFRRIKQAIEHSAKAVGVRVDRDSF